MKKKRKLFLTKEFQRINAEGMMEIGNHHSANNTVIVAGKNH